MTCIREERYSEKQDLYEKSLGGKETARAFFCANNGFEFDKTPQGKESELYKSLMNLYNDETRAIVTKSRAYTPEFARLFGNWAQLLDGDGNLIKGKDINPASLDKNGEPSVTDLQMFIIKQDKSLFKNKLYWTNKIHEVANRLGFKLDENSTTQFVDFANKVIHLQAGSAKQTIMSLCDICATLCPEDTKTELIKYCLDHGYLSNIPADQHKNFKESISKGKYSFVFQVYKGLKETTDKACSALIYDMLEDSDFYNQQPWYKKVIQFVRNILNVFSENRSEIKKLTTELYQDVLNRSSVWFNTVIEDGQEKKSLSVEQIKNAGLYDTYSIFVKHGAALDGSSCIRAQGALYRAIEESFHDLDFVMPYGDELKEIKTYLDNLDANIDYIFEHSAQYTLRGEFKRVIDNFRKQANENIWNLFKKSSVYKDLVNNNADVNFIRCFKTAELGVCLTIEVNGEPVDLFLSDSVNAKTINGVTVSHYSHALAAKVVMGRNKDVRDIINFRENASNSKLESRGGFVIDSPSTAIDLLIQGGLLKVYENQLNLIRDNKYKIPYGRTTSTRVGTKLWTEIIDEINDEMKNRFGYDNFLILHGYFLELNPKYKGVELLKPRTGVLVQKTIFDLSKHVTTAERFQQYLDKFNKAYGMNLKLVSDKTLAEDESYVDKRGHVHVSPKHFDHFAEHPEDFDAMILEECLHPIIATYAKKYEKRFVDLVDTCKQYYPEIACAVSLQYKDKSKEVVDQEIVAHVMAQALASGEMNDGIKAMDLFIKKQIAEDRPRPLSPYNGKEHSGPESFINMFEGITRDLREGKARKFTAINFDHMLDDSMLHMSTRDAKKMKENLFTAKQKLSARLKDERRRKLAKQFVQAQYKNTLEELNDVIKLTEKSQKTNNTPQTTENTDAILSTLDHIVQLELRDVEVLQSVDVTGLSNENLLFLKHSVQGIWGDSSKKLSGVLTDIMDSLDFSVMTTEQKDQLNQISALHQENIRTLGLYRDRHSVDSLIDAEIERRVVDLVNNWVDENVIAASEEQREQMKENLTHEVLGSLSFTKGGILNKRFAANAATNKDPLINMIWQMASETNHKSDKQCFDKGQKILQLMKEAFPNDLSLKNQFLRFCEIDEENRTTGYFIREDNYGRYHNDLKKFKDKLLRGASAKFKEGLLDEDDNVINGDWVEDVDDYGNKQIVFKDEQTENAYLDEIDDWVEKHAVRRYKAEYYKQKRRFLSKDVRQQYTRLQRNIDALKAKGLQPDGTFYRFKLTRSEQIQLVRAQRQLDELLSFYYYDAHGDLCKKTGDALEAAEQLYAWNQYLKEHVKYKIDEAKYQRDLQKVIDEYGNGSPEVAAFINDNTNLFISDEFMSAFMDDIQRVPYDEATKALLNILKYKYANILKKTRTNANQGAVIQKYGENSPENKVLLFSNAAGSFHQPDLSKLTKSDWEELQRLDQEMADIKYQWRKAHPQPQSKSPFGEYAQMVPVADYHKPAVGGRPVTYYKEHLDAGNLYQYEYAPGKKRALGVYYYMAPLMSASNVKLNGAPVTVTRPHGQYQTVDVQNSDLADTRFDDTRDEALQLISSAHTPGFSKSWGVDYKNDKFDEIKNNSKFKKLYDALLETMWEADSMYNMATGNKSYKLPQMHEKVSSLFINRGLNTLKDLTWGQAKYAVDQVINPTEQDTEFSYQEDLYADGTTAGHARKRFVQMLDDPEHISTDLFWSVMSYYICANKFKNTQNDEALFRLVTTQLQNVTPSDSVERTALPEIQDMVDTYLYDVRSTAQSTASKRAVKIQRIITKITTLSLLNHNMGSYVKGAVDASTRFAAMMGSGKYGLFSSYLWAGGQIAKDDKLGILSTANIGTARNYSKSEALMQLFQVGDDLAASYRDMNKSRITRISNKTTMGEFAIADHAVTKHILYSQLDRYRLYIDEATGEMMYLNEAEFRSKFADQGKSKDDAMAAYKKAEPLYNAFYFKNGKLDFAPAVKDASGNVVCDYKKLVTPKLFTKVRAGTVNISNLTNGYAPEGVKHQAIYRSPWMALLVTTRSYFLSGWSERFKRGYGFGKYHRDANGRYTLKKGENKNTLIYNVENGTVDESRYFANFRAGRVLFHNALHMFTDQKYEHLTENQKMAAKESALLALRYAIFIMGGALFGKLAAGVSNWKDEDEEWTLDKWLIFVGFSTFASLTVEASTFWNPSTVKDLVNSPTTVTTLFAKQATVVDTMFYLWEFIRQRKLDNETDDAYGNTSHKHRATDIVKRGAYKGKPYWVRSLFKTLSGFGFGTFDNTYRSFSINARKASAEYTIRNLSPADVMLGGSYEKPEKEKKNTSTHKGFRSFDDFDKFDKSFDNKGFD